jgi:hypothetical protein
MAGSGLRGAIILNNSAGATLGPDQIAIHHEISHGGTKWGGVAARCDIVTLCLIH